MIFRYIIQSVALLLILASFLPSCITYRYSPLDIPNVRKVDKYDGERYLGAFYQKYDSNTNGWYEAEKNDKGAWIFTARGKRDMENSFMSSMNIQWNRSTNH